MKTMVWGNKIIVVEGNRVIAVMQDEKKVLVLDELFIHNQLIYGIYNEVHIPISYGADITAPGIVRNYAAIELTSALSIIGKAMAVVDLLGADFRVDHGRKRATVILDGTPLSTDYKFAYDYRRDRYNDTAGW